MGDNEYFEIISAGNKLLHIELKNYWGDKVIDEIGPKFVEAYKSAVDTFNNTAFIVLTDLSSFQTPSKKGQEYLSQAVNYALQNGLQKAIQIIPHPTVKLSEMIAEDKADKHDARLVAGNLEEAMKLVDILKKQL